MRRPPPIPKKPETKPAAKATAPVTVQVATSAGRSIEAVGRRGRSIVAPTTSISRPKRNIRCSPSVILPSVEPANAPSAPMTAKIPAQRQRTFPLWA